MRNNTFIITQSGWSYLGISFIAFTLFYFLDLEFLAFIAFVITLLFAFLFRNPERELLHLDEQSILSPVDGFVSAIETLEDDPIYGYRIDIVSEYKHLCILRMPFDATLQSIQMKKGARVSKESPLFEALNENTEIVFELASGATLKIQHRLTQSFAPLEIDILPSQKLFQGSRYGMMQSGVTSIYLPATLRIDVHLLQELKASQTLISFLS